VLRALNRFLAGGAQLDLELDRIARPVAPPQRGDAAGELLSRLRRLGLSRIARCSLTRNRHVMVSFSAGALRVHEGYVSAPPEVLRAIVVFVEGVPAPSALRRSA
jgi:hypothetical protein